MLAKFYQNIVLKKPSLILIFLLICLCFFGYHSKNFRLDASSETLLIEGDPDLKYLNEINDRYGAKEFLVLTYTPKKRMIDESCIKNLLKLKNQIQKCIPSVDTRLNMEAKKTTQLSLPQHIDQNQVKVPIKLEKLLVSINH